MQVFFLIVQKNNTLVYVSQSSKPASKKTADVKYAFMFKRFATTDYFSQNEQFRNILYSIV